MKKKHLASRLAKALADRLHTAEERKTDSFGGWWRRTCESLKGLKVEELFSLLTDVENRPVR